jgi:dipeptidyl aminopeptidase/acylaminoacyl peptidase
VNTPTACWLLLSLILVVPSGLRADSLQTVAEKSDYAETSRHADVMDFCQKLAKESALVRLSELGSSHEGRKLPLVILADPPVSNAEAAKKSGKLVVFAMGNIHAGEVDGKEALLMLARDLATAKEHPLLKDLVIVFAPNFNPDGNEKIAKSNRKYQPGPAVGIRENAQGLDLNRDFVKLESPEVRALVRFLNQWDPAVVVDCHTTNGSYHRYTMTYDGPGVPAGDAKLIAHVRDEMFPELTRRLKKEFGYESYFYGNFSPDRSKWETVLPAPRYGTHYVGLRNRIGILAESYAYAPFKDRIRATYGFVKGICEYTVENKDKVKKLLDEARKPPKPGEPIALRYKEAPLGRPHQLLGYVEETKDGKRVRTDTPKEYEVVFMGATETTLAVPLPWAYLFPASFSKVTELLQRHGIQVEELREDIELDVEAYRIDKIAANPSIGWMKHRLVLLEATARKESRRVPAGTILVRTSQRLGSLASFLLEPQALDGLAAWNFFNEGFKEGGDFPVLRLPADVPITKGRVRPRAEDRTMNKPITVDTQVDFNGSPASIIGWLDDGEHFLQVKDGKLWKVQAVTGRCQPFHDPKKLAAALAALPTIGKDTAQVLSSLPREGRRRGGAGPRFLETNPKHTAALFQHENDLYFCDFEGKKALRLTKSPGQKELVSFSPNGEFVAFIRDNNLYVVDIATQTERALTTDGTDVIFNGKADWVYFEEIFDRDRRAYWWSPDSSRIAFVRYDDRPVHKFTVLDQIPTRQNVELTPYPKAGDPNPLVKLGIVAAGGGDVRWADLNNYSETSSLLLRAGWTPGGGRVWFLVQDRAQTWLDVCTISPAGGTPTRLFRETGKAWIDDPGPLQFLKDGSFLINSSRSGYMHIYRYDSAGKLLNAVTGGSWEVDNGPFVRPGPDAVDEASGWVYFRAKRDSGIASNFYRAKLDGSQLQRLTNTPGDHRTQLSPKCHLFVDSFSSHEAPSKVRLCKADGSPARTMDTNPVYIREEYRTGKYELVRIPAGDGVELDGAILKPSHFDPTKRYPVWLQIYGGPHLPTVRDSWGRTHDEALAEMGFIVFHCDPRSSTQRGHLYNWACYRQLGIQELKDFETAVHWISQNPWVDPARIGISGTSYGGYMTCFALTHSKLFAAGVAGAPVTDWHNYDSIYTERYMNTPQENPDGYEKTSVVKAAKDLHGKLLLIHGLMDDNVHVQNVVQLMGALQTAGKDFEVMLYPRARHGGFGRHAEKLTLDFMKQALKPGT